jgi:hypothetical protein
MSLPLTENINALLEIQGLDLSEVLNHNQIGNLLIECRDEILRLQSRERTLEKGVLDLSVDLDVTVKKNEHLKKISQFLFAILDDIDTASDMAKDNDILYRSIVETMHKQRFSVATTDGYNVYFVEKAE